jgi:hypothetical protein
MTIAIGALDKVCGGRKRPSRPQPPTESFNDRWKNSMQDIADSQPLEYSNRRYRERAEEALKREGQRRLDGQ